MRKTKSLNYDWYFIDDFKDSYLKLDYDYSKLNTVNIPHTMKELPFNYFNQNDYQFIGTYFRNLEIEESDLESSLFIQFKGVMNKTEVFINQELIFTHEGGYTPFSISINEFVKIGDNRLVVKVDGHEIKDIPPFGNLVDYLPYSGIYREVFLLVKPKVYIKRLHLFADDVNVLNQSEMLLNFNIKIEDDVNPYKVKARILFEGKLLQEELFEEEIIKSGILSTKVSNILRWDIDNPNLYDIEVIILNKEGLEVDKVIERFGFRTVIFTDNGFLLNNQPVKLMGLNRHQSYPYMGYAAPKSMQEKDAEVLKSLGCNIVRTSHYMQSDYFLNRCDELGLLVFEEIPGWNYIGNESFKDLSLRNLAVMINHHYNHPSICLWGVRINESKDDHEFYQKTNELAKTIDPSRQTGGVRNFKNSELLENVYTYNDFSHTGLNEGLENPRKVSKIRSPYLVTEYNGHVFPTKKFDTESRRIEHSLRHLNVIEYSHYYDGISGAIGWCMADYNTHFQFGSNDMICHHGVLDMHRLEKYAAYAYKSQKSAEKEVVLFVASNMVAGDYDLLILPEVVIYTNCDYVDIYRNDEFVGSYFPDEENYAYSPNPPIIIEDLIGDMLEKNESYKPKDAKRIKSLLLSYNKYGQDLPISQKIKMLGLLIRKVINFDDAVNLYMKYLANQETKPTVYRIEGFLDDKLVKTVYKGHLQSSSINVKPDSLTLKHDLTYDLVRVVIEMVDQFGNVLNYGNEVVKVKTDSKLQLVGPENIALSGGSFAVYLKTTGVIGNSKVEFSFNNYSKQTIEFKIEKGILEF